MKKQTFVGLFLILSLLGASNAVANRGGGSDGGACSVRVNGALTLVDFVRANMIPRTQTRSSSQLQIGEVGKVLGFEILDGRNGTQDLRQTPAYVSASQLVERWRLDSPGFAQFLGEALSSLHFAGIDREIRPIAFGCQEAENSPIFVYDRQMGFAYLSLPTWNQLSHESQVGALLKEAVRLLQAEFQNEFFQEGLTNRSEALLSEIVATIVTRSPRSRAGTIDQIFQRHGLNAPGNTHELREVNSKFRQACEFARRGGVNCRIQPLSSLFSEEEFLSALNTLRAATDLLSERMQNASNDQTVINLGRSYEGASSILMSLLATKMTLSVQSPALRSSMRNLEQITRSMETCNQTSTGRSCQMRGYLAILSLSESISKGEHRNIFNFSLRNSIEQAQEHFARVTAQVLR